MATQTFGTTTTLAAIIPEIWVAESLGYLQANTVTASLVRRDFSPVVARQGDIVNISSRSTLTKKAKSASTQIDIEAPTNTNIAVTLTDHAYIAFGVEDIAEAQAQGDFIGGYVEDGAAVLAEDIDAALLALYVDAGNTSGTGGTDIGIAAMVNGRKELNTDKIPIRNRSLIISSKDDAALLQIDTFIEANKIGDDGTALREASLGRLFGWSIFMDQQVKTTGTSPVTTHNLGFHRDGMTLVTRPLPLPPPGLGVLSSIYNKDGIAMRFTAAWSQRDMSTVMVLDLLYGVKTLRANALVDVKG